MELRALLSRVLEDPPPPYVFEVTEAGVYSAAAGEGYRIRFTPFEPDTLAVSPVKDNVLRPDAFAAVVRGIYGQPEKRRRRDAVLILPDNAVRVFLLEFEKFPTDAAEQESLVRFRLKKSVPFDVESSVLSFVPQMPEKGGMNGARRVVTAAVAPVEILAPYEAPFRAAGYHPGLLTTATLTALELLPPQPWSLLAKCSGRVLTITVWGENRLRILRCMELTSGGVEETLEHLYPTFAYVEDQFGRKVEQVFVSGFGELAARLKQELGGEEGVSVALLRTRQGEAAEACAGLQGYLEAMGGRKER